MSYYNRQRIDDDFETVVSETIEALEDEGFGVLTDIDVSAKFSEKLGLSEYPNYRILGACNPELAHQGLEAERNLGVLLPCNVVVYETDGDVMLSFVDPSTLLSIVDSDNLDPLIRDVTERFDRVLETVQSTAGDRS
ncbi:DUF302 domain-containing protein [Halocatena halophila]|uniref:DUF302 domain-containing protein n=1 Tax=Halocatena halophila TaxID=2814576 RepID=UPI002ED657F5